MYYRRISLYVFILATVIITKSSANKNIFCYYSNREFTKDAQFTVEKVDPLLCTHLVYFNVGVNNKAEIIKKNYQIQSDFEQFYKLKTVNKNLKTLIDVGGSQYLEEFYKILTNEDLRKTWSKNIVEFAINYKFDGVYVHWYHKNLVKYAFSNDIKENFTLLLKEFRKATNEKGLLLASQIVTTDVGIVFFDIPKIVGQVDFLCLYTESIYLAAEYEKKTTARFRLSRVKNTIFNAIINGIPVEKLVFQINHFRPEEFRLIYKNITNFDAPTTGSRVLHKFTKLCGRNLKGFNNIWDKQEFAMYAYKGNQWVSYENRDSLSIKVNFMLSMNLTGIMVDLHEDDYKAVCKEENYPMIRHIQNTINMYNNTNLLVYKNTSDLSNLDIEQHINQITSTNGMQVSSRSICKTSGYVNDPNDCDKFYYCMKDKYETFKTHEFNCRSGFLFDDKLLVCNYLYIFGKQDSLY